jgi:glyoxylase-like metal-dependent hydrolase (beta-lactamase superfamily II)
MASIDVLVEGYTRERVHGWAANATTTLITTESQRIVVDPGMDKKALLTALKKKALEPADITDVFITHFHVDHMLNISVFPEARLVDGWCTISQSGGIFHRGHPFGQEIKSIPTPGHTPEHASLIVDIRGKVHVIAGDIIWYPAKNLKEALTLTDPYAYDTELLHKSRTLVWQTADVIIPGHGPAFSRE